MPCEFAGRTDPGRVRTNNEDSWRIDERSGLFLVADGMGGHNAGEVASGMAADVVSRHFAATGQLASSIELANSVIYEAGHSAAQYLNMGTTVVALALKGETGSVAWVGDSRLYLLRGGTLRQLTTDHSMVQEQVAKGLIAAADAPAAAYRNVLTRALGVEPTVAVDTTAIEAVDGDCFLLCSDGLHALVPDASIGEVLAAAATPAAAAEQLVAAANAAGGKDNVTVIVVRYAARRFWSKIFR